LNNCTRNEKQNNFICFGGLKNKNQKNIEYFNYYYYIKGENKFFIFLCNHIFYPSDDNKKFITKKYITPFINTVNPVLYI